MPDITEQLNKYFKDLDIDIEDFNNIALQLQKNNDILQSGLKSCNVSEFRNTYVINAQDSLDDTYSMYVHFNIIDEMTKIVSVKLSFWLLPFRAYSTTVPSGGGHTTAAGGGHTTASGGGSTSGSGGGQTSAAASAGTTRLVIVGTDTVTNVGDENASGYLPTSTSSLELTVRNHTHTVDNHTHSTPNHIHAVADHQHAVADHAHALTFGIHEEDNSPTVGFQISRDNGKTYGAILGKYTADVTNLEIKDYITASGSYIIKFTSSARARLSVQATIKLDISAR